MLTVEDLYRSDIAGKIVSISGGRELRGPCPHCGGEDRFGVWPQQNDGRGSYYCGRERGAGNGCGKGGDAIQYLRDFHGMSYKAACLHLGIEPKGGGGKHLRYVVPAAPRRYSDSACFVPEAKTHPPEVVDVAKWREHGIKFVDSCHQALLKRPTSIAYLLSRGISRKSIDKYKLGFHHGETRRDQQYQPSYRPWPSWGLRDEKNDKGMTRKLILPAGLVIPYIVDGQLHRITIRLVKPDPRNPKVKYHYVKGSSRDPWLVDSSTGIFIVQEAELDCIAVDDAAGDLMGTIGLGSTGVKPDVRTAEVLSRSKCILGGLDFDAPKLNKRTGKKERPGATAGLWWKKQYPQYRRCLVPEGKDAGDAFRAGVDLRLWILAGIPDNLQPRPPEKVAEEQRIKKILHEKMFPPTAEVKELRDLLEESDGFVRVYDKGLGVGTSVNPEWSAKHPEKRRRISELLFTSESIGIMISNLEDGLYHAVNIPV